MRQRIHGCQAVGNDVRTREIHIAEQQIASGLENLRVGHQRHHGVHGLLALAVVAWPNVHHHVVQAHGNVVQHLAGGLAFVQGHQVGLAVGADDTQHALGVVHLGDQVQNNLARVLDAAGHVVVKVEVRQVNLLLLALQSLAGNVAWQRLGRVKNAQHGFQVVSNGSRGHHDAFRRWFWLDACRHGRGDAFNVFLLVTQNRR